MTFIFLLCKSAEEVLYLSEEHCTSVDFLFWLCTMGKQAGEREVNSQWEFLPFFKTSYVS